MVHEGQILSAEQLVERVWGYSGDKDKELARNLVRRLRSKLEPDPKNPEFLVTVPGAGYVLLPKNLPA
jgi:DNA-binding response OmpR family regulator